MSKKKNIKKDYKAWVAVIALIIFMLATSSLVIMLFWNLLFVEIISVLVEITYVQSVFISIALLLFNTSVNPGAWLR